MFCFSCRHRMSKNIKCWENHHDCYIVHLSGGLTTSLEQIFAHDLGWSFFITFEVKTKFASMGNNKSFSRSLYSPLQKQIHMISILPNRELLKHSIMKCGGTVCNFINAYFFCGTTFSESVDHMGFLIPQSYYWKCPVKSNINQLWNKHVS